MPNIPYQPHASLYNSIRHHVYAIFEKTQDIDKALTAVSVCASQPDLFHKWYAGLKGELLVYSKSPKLKLEPLLDAGVKADFAGVRNGRPVNIDVTTNLDYKNINDYAELTVKKKKLYEIAAVDLRTEEIEFFPLRFPICHQCGNFSHYILRINEPDSGSLFWASQGQILSQYCTKCDTNAEISSYSYMVPSPFYALKDRMDEELDSNEKMDEQGFLSDQAIPIAKLFEKTSGKMLSAVSEMNYEILDPSDGDGDWFEKTIWKRPLVEETAIMFRTNVIYRTAT